MDYNDSKTWRLFEEGKTKGIFQLESNLGKSWSKKVNPKNLEELSALIAIIRPGSLKSIFEGKSMTQHYVDRKSGKDEITYLHPALESVLGSTYGVLCYQEQSMLIAKEIAGFNLQEADVLRKAIGKKKADLMAKVRKSFIDGAQEQGIVNEQEAEEIFGWIEKSSRYAFNKSHSVSYAVCSYWSAYEKANNPLEFFLAYLYYASEKQDPHQEIYELISEAKLFEIEVRTPSIRNYKSKFNAKRGKIYFGVKDIKGLTGKSGDKVSEAIPAAEKELKKKVKDFTWLEILLYLSPKMNSTAFTALASVGFFRGFTDDVSRNKALYDYEIFRSLTKAELKWVMTNYPEQKWETFTDCLTALAPTKKEGGGTHKLDRKLAISNEIQLINNPPYSLEDDASWIIDQETRFLGCPITLTKIDTVDNTASNTSCKDILNGKVGQGMALAVNVQRIGNHTITKGNSSGRTMSFLTVEDDTCSLDSVIIFPDTRDKYKYVLYEGNNLLLYGSVKQGDGSFIVDKIHEI